VDLPVHAYINACKLNADYPSWPLSACHDRLHFRPVKACASAASRRQLDHACRLTPFTDNLRLQSDRLLMRV